MKEIQNLYETTAALRSENGCPWDKEQTHLSITGDLIEEAWELIDSIKKNDYQSMKEELGDVLFQVMFHSLLAEENGAFTFEDVATTINEKLIRRHPHVFGEKQEISVDQVLDNWDEIKKKEKATIPESVLSGVPESFPSLLKAEKIQKKAARAGFDWEAIGDVEHKLKEEVNEFSAELRAFNQNPSQENRERLEDELGDILFTIVNISRFLGLSSEEALQGSIQKFKRRFQTMERMLSKEGKEMKKQSMTFLDELWNQAKASNK